MASKEDSKSQDIFSEENAKLCMEMLKKDDTFEEALYRFFTWINQGHIEDGSDLSATFQKAIAHVLIEKSHECDDYQRYIRERNNEVAEAAEAVCYAIRKREKLLNAVMKPENFDFLTKTQQNEVVKLMEDHVKDSITFENELLRSERKVEIMIKEESKANLEAEIRNKQQKIQELREELHQTEARKHELLKTERILKKYKQKLRK